MRFCLFDRGPRGPLRFVIDINLNLNIRDETGLGEQLGLLKTQLDASTEKLENAVAEAKQPNSGG